MRTTCVCGQSHADYWGTRDGISLVRCRTCDSGRPAYYDQGRYVQQYTSGAYHRSETPGRRRRHAAPYADRYDHDCQVAQLRLQALQHFHTAGRLLDVGCGNGALVTEARAAGWDAHGLDVSAAGLPRAGLLPSVRSAVRVSRLENLEPSDRQQWDVLTFYDVLEHCVDPNRELLFARALLKPNGLLVIDTPDLEAQGVDNPHVKPDEHVWYFSLRALSGLLQQAGFSPCYADRPLPGKLTLYARPTPPEQEVIIYVPPGTGDIDWVLTALQALRAQHEPCSLTVRVSSLSAPGLITRSADFLALVPFVDQVEFDQFPFAEDAGQMLPDFPHYLLYPNAHLESGKHLEDWRPEWEKNYDYPLFSPLTAQRWAEQIRAQAGSPFLLCYLSRALYYQEFLAPGLWSIADWRTVLDGLTRAYGRPPVLVGARWDEAYAEEVCAPLAVKPVSVIGQTSWAQMLDLARLADCIIGPACGNTLVSNRVGAPAVVFWPEQEHAGVGATTFHQKFAWSMIGPAASRRYQPLHFGRTATPVAVFAAVARLLTERREAA